jgi:hypothetical protein
MLYLTAFVVEKTLALDNVFVIALIFSFFAHPAEYQHRVLFWGILGVIVLRGIMIGLGATLVSQYSWDPLHLRGVPDLHRHPMMLPGRRAHGHRQQPDPALDARRMTHHRRDPRPRLLRAEARPVRARSCASPRRCSWRWSWSSSRT